ncbi:hypothetical protein ACQB60_40125 [Actinomycetota bacterium Odt1-20B]
MPTPTRRAARTALAAAAALTAVTALGAAVAPAAAADPSPPPPVNWGTVLDLSAPAQANAWSLRVLGRGVGDDIRVAEAHHPAAPGTPALVSSAPERTYPLATRRYTFGSLRGVRSATAERKGTVTASSHLEQVTLGLPYLTKPGRPSAPPPVLALELTGADASASSARGKPLALATTTRSGSVSAYGTKLRTFKEAPAANTGLRVPANPLLPAQALVTLNEQITTDAQGHPSTAALGGYRRDAHATSGYVNAAHMTLLTPEPTDMTVAHAAVIRSD